MKISTNIKVESTWKTYDGVNVYESKLVYKLNYSEMQKKYRLLRNNKKIDFNISRYSFMGKRFF